MQVKTMQLAALRRGSRRLLLGVALSSAAISVMGFLHLRNAGGHKRLRPITELNAGLVSGDVHLSPAGDHASRTAFSALLSAEGFSPGSANGVKTVLRLQVWVGNQVSHVGPYEGTGRGFALLQHGRQGGGLTCLGMSDVLREALLLLDIPARTVQLTESEFRRTSHVVVEAFVEGRWQAFDPTFNVTYESDGRPLGVSEIQERLWTEGPMGVTPAHHGQRRYPADLERDAKGWRRYFANAYVYDLGQPLDRWKSLPPWRYWTGPSIYYYGDHLMLFSALQDWVYFWVTVPLPLISLLTALPAILPRRLRQI
jgi:hypothetical protein